MVAGFLIPALDAAIEVGRRTGLPTDSPEVLAHRSNVLVRLGPAVARVPATTRLLRPRIEAWMARDVALSAFLAERDAPVIPPSEAPGPHLANGLPVTLWRFTRHDPGHAFAPAEVSAVLGELHAALREYPGDLADAGPVGDLERMLDLIDDDRLRDAAERVVAGLPRLPAQPLHGDAHGGNLVQTEQGPRWLDFEDTWRGPLAWDLACLARSSRLDGEAAVAAYPGDVDGLAPYLELRELFGVCWRFVIARRFPERLTEAREALAAYLG